MEVAKSLGYALLFFKHKSEERKVMGGVVRDEFRSNMNDEMAKVLATLRSACYYDWMRLTYNALHHETFDYTTRTLGHKLAGRRVLV